MASSKYVVLTQETDPADYCRIYRGASTYNITAVNQGAKTFYIAENRAYELLDGSTFTVAGSDGGLNDGDYTCDGNATWTGAATEILVEEVIPNQPVAYPDGTIGAIWTHADNVVFTPTNETAVKLWVDANDVLYIGKDSKFGIVGFGMATAPVGYGTFTLEYWNGAWVTLTPKDNNLSNFTASGFMDWAIEAAWVVTTVNGKSAYWIRASQSAVSPGTAAEAYNFLPTITLNPPLILDWQMTIDGNELYHFDINNTARKTDYGDNRPRRLTIDCTHLAATLMELSLMRYWDEFQKRVHIKDLSQSSPVALATDSYFRTGSGYIHPLPGNIESPGKMDSESYQLTFTIDTVTTIMQILSITS